MPVTQISVTYAEQIRTFAELLRDRFGDRAVSICESQAHAAQNNPTSTGVWQLLAAAIRGCD